MAAVISPALKVDQQGGEDGAAAAVEHRGDVAEGFAAGLLEQLFALGRVEKTGHGSGKDGIGLALVGQGLAHHIQLGRQLVIVAGHARRGGLAAKQAGPGDADTVDPGGCEIADTLCAGVS
ncbi:hypothetical protein, partial [Thiohalophilus sp.]|uniref:hypothetical protein n=1 Tax=Thiohalophilus sp. TaxID=3028392 RepID=UPI002ACE6B1F